MKALVQRVSYARVGVGGETVGEIGRGLLILLGIGTADTEREAAFVADKCANLRIFEDEAGKMNLSLLDIGGEALVISQFTLYGDASHGRRPSFSDAAPPEQAEPLYRKFVELLKTTGITVATGRFRAEMAVELCNDGPVTIMVESR
jgi:D-tyrosyl-tRNA(Tyr) deacylase